VEIQDRQTDRHTHTLTHAHTHKHTHTHTYKHKHAYEHEYRKKWWVLNVLSSLLEIRNVMESQYSLRVHIYVWTTSKNLQLSLP